jgi:hypothetical protein
MALVDESPSSGAVRPVLEAARAALRAVGDLDLDVLWPDELTEVVLATQRLRTQLEAAEARALARWEAVGSWRIDGARTAAAWLTWKQRLPIAETRRRVRHARAVRSLPAIADAWAAGEIDRTHVALMLSVRNPRTEGAFERDHEKLLEVGRSSRFTDFQTVCRRWEQIVDPDGAEQDADAERSGRSVHLSQGFLGSWLGHMSFDAVSGMIVHETLDTIERELFQHDWAAAKERLGRDPLILELDRTPPQRRADAMVEMATRARSAPDGARRPAPLFTVLVGYETFAGPTLELFNRTVLTPGTAARWLAEADVERVVFESPSRVIDVGEKRRFFRGALRRAVEVRDRECFHPTCEEVAHLDIDHIQPASRGGATTLSNGRPGCGFHNRLRNDPAFDDVPYPRLGDPDAGPDPPDR